MKFLKHWPLFWILCASCLQLFCGVARGAISEPPTIETLGLTENGPWNSDTITYGYTYGRRSSLSVDRPSTSDWTQTYSYDGNGNLTDDGNTEYTYDHENRLTQTEWQTGADYWRESYTYDGLSRLREIYREHSNNGTTWTFSSEKHLVYDGMLVVQERDGSNNVEAHYTRGLDLSGTLDGAGGIGGILAREWSSNTAFYHSDAGGNVTRLVDSSGNVQATYQYDPYGDLLSQSGAWASANPYLFSGKRFLGDGLYYYGYRFYNTDLQRWINKDPLGEAGGINLYGFVGNGPVDSVDPLGLFQYNDDGTISLDGNETALSSYTPDQETLDMHRRVHCEGMQAIKDAAVEVAVDRATGGLGRIFRFLKFGKSCKVVRSSSRGNAAKSGSREVDEVAGSETLDDALRTTVAPGLPRKIHPGQQGKHTPGARNFNRRRSPLNKSVNPQSLLDGVHSGQFPIVRNTPSGRPIVDFGATIGEYNGAPTRFGQVHYGKKGAHIVPANPVQY